MLCQKLIPLQSDDKGRMISNTYCMREAGHDGKCSPQHDHPKPVQK